ncbi:hypothetical protein HGRIS_000475 [Hohenbuehelia grisea]|uniref:F-box domain-containing protein n=1 Tax=Hohenbuehelia grisea TaxID=104357 RepID=A0ABR3JT16_9AGAR
MFFSFTFTFCICYQQLQLEYYVVLLMKLVKLCQVPSRVRVRALSDTALDYRHPVQLRSLLSRRESLPTFREPPKPNYWEWLPSELRLAILDDLEDSIVFSTANVCHSFRDAAHRILLARWDSTLRYTSYCRDMYFVDDRSLLVIPAICAQPARLQHITGLIVAIDADATLQVRLFKRLAEAWLAPYGPSQTLYRVAISVRGHGTIDNGSPFWNSFMLLISQLRKYNINIRLSWTTDDFMDHVIHYDSFAFPSFEPHTPTHSEPPWRDTVTLVMPREDWEPFIPILTFASLHALTIQLHKDDNATFVIADLLFRISASLQVLIIQPSTFSGGFVDLHSDSSSNQLIKLSHLDAPCTAIQPIFHLVDCSHLLSLTLRIQRECDLRAAQNLLSTIADNVRGRLVLEFLVYYKGFRLRPFLPSKVIVIHCVKEISRIFAPNCDADAATEFIHEVPELLTHFSCLNELNIEIDDHEAINSKKFAVLEALQEKYPDIRIEY